MANFLSSSRYTNTSTTVDGANAIVAVRRRIPARTYTSYTAVDGDSFDLLAQGLYNDPSRWWEIADINPQVLFPDKIPAGTPVRIPKS